MTNKDAIDPTIEFDTDISRFLSGLGMVFTILSLGFLLLAQLIDGGGDRLLLSLCWSILTIGFLENTYLHRPSKVSYIISGFGIFFSLIGIVIITRSSVGMGLWLFISIGWILFIIHRGSIVVLLKQKRVGQLNTGQMMEYGIANMSKIYSVFGDFMNHSRNPWKLSFWAYIIIALDIYLIGVLSFLGFMVVLESVRGGIFMFLLVVIFIYLLVLVSKGSEIALLINSIVGLFIGFILYLRAYAGGMM